MAAEIVVPTVVVERIARRSGEMIARALVAPLDAGDVETATAVWRRECAKIRARAETNGYPIEVVDRVISRLSADTREALVRLRGSHLAGARHRTKTDDGRTLGKLLAFPTRTEPLPAPSFAAYRGPDDQWESASFYLREIERSRDGR